jgi:hypothetical protein
VPGVLAAAVVGFGPLADGAAASIVRERLGRERNPPQATFEHAAGNLQARFPTARAQARVDRVVRHEGHADIGPRGPRRRSRWLRPVGERPGQRRRANHLLTGTGKKLLDRALAAADVNLTPSANGGVSIITLAKDSVVTPNNFDALLKAYPGKIANAIKLDENDFMVVSGVSGQLGRAVWVPTDHMHGLIYEFVYALHIFNTYAGGAKPPK